MTSNGKLSFMDKLALKVGVKKYTAHNTQGPAIDSVALCMIRNEQDIIEPFLRHTAARVDLVVVLDNCSTDGSRAIITKLAQELGNIVVSDLPDRGYHQSQTMTRVLAHVQSAVFADFVFFLDADEFLAGDSKQAVLEGLRGLAPMSVGLMPWVTYVPDASLSEDGVPDPLDRLTQRRTHEAPQYYKAVLRMAGGFDPALQVLQGNHHIKGGNGRKLRAQVLDAMPLAHMPLRSTAQMKAKGVIGWAANSQRKDAQHSKDAYQWKHLSELATSGTRLTTPLLMAQALAYAQDDRSGPPEDHLEAAAHGIDTTRQYSDGSFGDPDQLIADAKSGVMGDTQAFALPAPPAGSEQETEVSNAFMGNWHWDYLFLDEAPIRFAIERFAPASALDLGCGNGLYPALYRHLGVADVLGVDGLLPEATVLDAQSYVQADLQEPFDAGRKFDLVICLEVVEHINPAATDVLFDSIADQSKGHILFSMAQHGQPGNGHINCRDMDEVLALWAMRGWQPDLPATLGLRALSTMDWFRRNIVLLKHTGETDTTAAAEALRRIGQFDFVWQSQAPGQRAAAFQEDAPAFPKGYGRIAAFQAG